MNIFRKKKDKKGKGSSPSSSPPIDSPSFPVYSPERTIATSTELTPASSFQSHSPSLSLSRPQTPTQQSPGTPSSLSSLSPPFSSSLSSSSTIVKPTPISAAYFGVHLDDLLKKQNEKGLVPVLVDQCTNYLMNNDGFLVEGIFHIPGDNGLVQKIKQILDKGDRFDFGVLKGMCHSSAPGEDVRVVATILWMFLRQLPEPVMTFDPFNSLVESTQYASSDTVVSEIQQILPGLPPSNREIMRRVLPLLSKVTSHSYINKMSAFNISSIFSPCFFRSKSDALSNEQARKNSNSANQLTQVLIDYHPVLFDDSDSTSPPLFNSSLFSHLKSHLTPPASPSISSSSASVSSPLSNSSPALPTHSMSSPSPIPNSENKGETQSPKKDTTPQLNRWKYQTFTHSSAEKLRSSTTSLPISPIPPRAQTPPSSSLPPPSSSSLSSSSLSSSSTSLPPSMPPTQYSNSLYSSSNFPQYDSPAPSAVYPTSYPSSNPVLSSTRIHEIVSQQENRFRDMLQILQNTSNEIDKAIATNTSLGHQLTSLDEQLRHEAETLHNILEQEKAKATFAFI